MSSNKTSRERRLYTCDGGWRRKADSFGYPNYVTGTVKYNSLWNNTVVYGPNIVGWKQKMRDGLNVSTTLSGIRGTSRYSFGSATSDTGTPGANGYYQAYAHGALNASDGLNPYALPSGGLTSPINEAETRAMIAFTHDFRNKTSEFQTGVFMGELGEAVRMLASPAKAMRLGVDELYTRLLRVARKKPWRLMDRTERRIYKDAIAGTWLEWTYGVKPLISDLDSAATAFRAMASGRTFDIVRIKGQGSAAVAVNGSLPFQPGTPGFLSHADYNRITTIKKSVTVDIRGGWKNDKVGGLMPLPMTFELGVKDILPTAWELIPWSFFIDYFTNIGDVLDAWGMRFVDFAWLNKTVRERTEYIIRPPRSYWISPAGQRFTCYASIAHLSRWDVSRAPFTNQWNPRVMVKVPGLGSTKWLNIAALAQMKRPINR